jgi:competence protein ComEA
MKNWWGIPFSVACSLLAAGLLYLSITPPRGEPVQLIPPPAPPPLVVHVSGAVVNPGVYEFESSCRVREALEAAGGLLAEADAAALNLAAPLQDGERIWVPAKVKAEPLADPPAPEKAAGPAVQVAPTAPAETEPPPAPTPEYPININTATQAELESLPGIGPVIAGRIIAYRNEHGPFTRIEEIENVSGIGPKTFEKIKDLIAVTGNP